MAATANQTVSFAQFSADFSASLSLDSDYNETTYNEESKSSFLPNETAYLKLLPGVSEKAYSLGSSFGNFTLASRGVLYDYTEDINFVSSKEGALSFKPNAGVTYEWMGNNGGTPLFVDKAIILQNDTIGILRCSYKVLGDRLKLSNADLSLTDYAVLCVVLYEDHNAISLSVSFLVSDEIPAEVSLDVVVRDMCTGDVIPGASIVIEGVQSGTTGDDGVFSPTPKIMTGQEYSIRATASGYVSSDVDFLKNDSFLIPIETTETEETE